MMLSQKILNIQESNYSSSLTTDVLKTRIKELFNQKNKLNGKLISNEEFVIHDTMTVVGWSLPKVPRKSAYLKGKITQGSQGQVVQLNLSPNKLLAYFSIFASLLGVLILFISFFNSVSDIFLLTIGSTLFSLGIAYHFISIYLRNRLRNRVVGLLGLRIQS